MFWWRMEFSVVVISCLIFRKINRGQCKKKKNKPTYKAMEGQSLQKERSTERVLRAKLDFLAAF